VTWQASQINKIAVFFDRQERCWCTRQIGPTLSPEATNPTEYPNTSATSVTWSAPSRAVVAGGRVPLSVRTMGIRAAGRAGRALVGVLEQSSGLRYRGPVAGGTSGGCGRARLNLVANYRGAVSYITGSHALKSGSAIPGPRVKCPCSTTMPA
jgi:hypothetical protein